MIRQPVKTAPPMHMLTRMARLASLDADAVALLERAIATSDHVPARRELIVEGSHIDGPRLIVAGWAAQLRLLADGRRQFLSFLLPGDLIGWCRQPDPIATSTVMALTDLSVAAAPPIALSPSLEAAYSTSHAISEAYFLEQIARLGRLNAAERITSLLLELHERLTLNGMADGDGFDAPFTQEILADALGLTSVHVNRMLQQARRNGDLHWHGGRVTLRNRDALARWVGRRPVRVTASQAL